MSTTLFINPGRRRRARRPARRKTARKVTRRNPIVKRRRKSSHRRRSRRRVFRNPGFPKIAKGLDIQGAVLAVVGAAAAKFIVNRIPGITDNKMKAAATIGAGVVLGMLPIGPMRSKLALGGQIAGFSLLLNEFAPGMFADDPTIVPYPGVEVLSAGDVSSLSVDPAPGSGW